MQNSEKIISPNFKKLEEMWKSRQAHYLAPMAGLTNDPFRRLMKKLGASVTVSELISATGMIYGSQKTMELAQVSAEEHQLGPVGIQLFGDEAGKIVQASQILSQQAFAQYIDFIDINMGCPVPKVTKKGGGSSLLRDMVYLSEFLSEIVQNCPYPVTIKIRIGWDEQEKTGPQVAEVAQKSGVRALAVHGRTRAQGYAGLADWDFIAKIAESTTLPVIGNGDILSANQAKDLLNTYPSLAGVMIGRGSLKDPWIFNRLKSLQSENSQTLEEANPFSWSFSELISVLNEFLTAYGNEHFRNIQIKKFACWFSHGLEGAAHFRKDVFACQTPSEVLSLTHNFFAGWDGKNVSDKVFSPILMGGHG